MYIIIPLHVLSLALIAGMLYIRLREEKRYGTY